MRKSGCTMAALLAALTISLPLIARAADDKTPAKTAEKEPAQAVTTQGAVDAGGQHILYDAIAGTITVGATNEQDAQLGTDGKPQPDTNLAAEVAQAKDPSQAPPTARMFYVAYFKKDANPDQRPITFLYNGGPGSSTVWLHMGSFGPKHVVTEADTHLPAAPYKLVDNAESLLDVSDLVFVDMPGTGFGRLTGKDPEKAFWGIDEDGHAFGRFIQRFLSQYNRWNSPKYIFGESYGTTRSAVLGARLQRDGITLNGIVLMSSVLDFETLLFAPGHDLSYVLYLPSYAATAVYHKVIPAPANFPAFLSEVRRYAIGDYGAALAAGASLPADRKATVAKQLAAYTGLPEDYLVKADLRVNLRQFMAELQRSRGMVTGRLDSRFSGPLPDLLSEYAPGDPQSNAVTGAFTAAVNSYLRGELKFESPDRYWLGGGNNGQWNWTREGARGWATTTYVGSDLSEALINNPYLRVEIENGYYDLATPFFATEYTVSHLEGLSPELRDNIKLKYYDAGHMMYLYEPALAALKQNIARFIANPTPATARSAGGSN